MRRASVLTAVGAMSTLLTWYVLRFGVGEAVHAEIQLKPIVYAPTPARIAGDTVRKAGDTLESHRFEIATFGAGCFWGIEEVFRKVDGVVGTAVGYTGGHAISPDYREVCSGGTGHAESVQIQFDPTRVSYEQMLDIFWAAHDPTQSNKQGPDEGEQYRSVIFYHSPEQERAALASKERLQAGGKYDRPIVTQIVPAAEFYMAEDYHQQYLEKRHRGVCGY
jgi:peptide-methionine (S)-S-oxide reductase